MEIKTQIYAALVGRMREMAAKGKFDNYRFACNENVVRTSEYLIPLFTETIKRRMDETGAVVFESTVFSANYTLQSLHVKLIPREIKTQVCLTTEPGQQISDLEIFSEVSGICEEGGNTCGRTRRVYKFNDLKDGSAAYRPVKRILDSFEYGFMEVPVLVMFCPLRSPWIFSLFPGVELCWMSPTRFYSLYLEIEQYLLWKSELEAKVSAFVMFAGRLRENFPVEICRMVARFSGLHYKSSPNLDVVCLPAPIDFQLHRLDNWG